MCVGGKKSRRNARNIQYRSVLLDWKSHDNNYYECSKYRAQPQSQNETKQTRAREALKKYLHYFERVIFMSQLKF